MRRKYRTRSTPRRHGILQKPLKPEEALQASFVSTLALLQPKALYFHIPNGGARTAAEGIIFKMVGVRPGVFDFQFLYRNAQTLFLEFKVPPNDLTDTQQEFGKLLTNLSIPWTVATTVDQAICFLIFHGIEFEKPEFLTSILPDHLEQLRRTHEQRTRYL